ncbi:hypothetical protein GHT06_008101 [Daphnia sinensis]|uniref:Chitin-binding type-2 domain-containing protein n=1 Tax=Daphnia sinensis TaxID=1820382 RepID=A0AAD5PYN2_9CRUS|nr:hypothetical protein GHT06_008101 [Daphnia sinensis]
MLTIFSDACSNMYYVCSGGQLYIEYCPEDFVFDPILLKCVPKESASCSPTTTELPSTVSEAPTTESESPSTTETEAPTTETEAPATETETAATILEAPMLKAYKMTTSTEFTCPSDQHGLYANTCTTYYECTGGVPYLRGRSGHKSQTTVPPS